MVYKICAGNVLSIAILPLTSSLLTLRSLANCFKFAGRILPPPKRIAAIPRNPLTIVIRSSIVVGSLIFFLLA